MDTTTPKEMDRIRYVGKLMALTQLYLELNLSVTDAILAAESDLVTWKSFNLVSRAMHLSSRPIDKTFTVYGHAS